jgi:hypothetical protein
MKVIYVGEKYYKDGNLRMSSVYKVEKHGTLRRTDWGFIKLALQGGEEVHIRPANKSELKRMDNHLNAIEDGSRR